MKTQPSTLARATLVLSVLTLTTCGGQEGMDTAGMGQLSLVLASSAAPVASMQASSEHSCGAPQAASVTFSAILARTLGGTLAEVTIALPTTVDLLSMVNGKDATLPDGFLPPGTYDQFVVVMKSVELTLIDGTKVTITPPGGGWTAIVNVTQPFTVVAGQTTTVKLKFRRDLSFGCSLGGWEFHPKFECDGAN